MNSATAVSYRNVPRLRSFFRHRFPVPVQILTFCSFFLTYAMLSLFFFARPIDWLEVTIGGISLVLLTLLMRVADDIKDLHTDRIHFPERPTQDGSTTERDLKTLLWLLFFAIAFLNLIFIGRLVFVTVCMTLLFIFLLFKWLFLEKWIRPNLALAFFTHNPVIYFFQAYTLSFFVDAAWNSWAVMFLVGDGLIGTAWEVARKIRGQQEETAYVTYSKIWGRKGATGFASMAIVVALLFLFCAFRFGFQSAWPPGSEFAILLPVAMVARWFSLVVHFFRNSNFAPKFQRTVELFKGSIMAAELFLLALRWL